ncbi:MAG: sigma-54 dependent transcriptional regulator [Desulfohalobiaceae bacterium]|nr:sigma-54 dependent transcriptional regulator [Desulfohalobiaceae bacterium]
MSANKILIADDEAKMRRILQLILKKDEYEIDLAKDGSEAWRLCQEKTYHLLIIDLKMPGLDGLSLLERIGSHFTNLPVMVVTAYGSIESAVTAMKNGAFDYITKPFDKEEIRISVSKALQFNALKDENRNLRRFVSDRYDFQNLIGDSEMIQTVRELAAKVSPTQSTVLIQGESGTGKELLARIIHSNSTRWNHPFIAFNCAALPEHLIESELFGYEKGAFTGAIRQKPGRFELADNGTLFFDEIGEMHPELQTKMLRVLQEKCLERLGGTKSLQVDVRLIAATNSDLKTKVETGQFRADLYYRLNIFPIQIPPVRKHKEDLPQLIRHSLAKLSLNIGKPVQRISEKAMAVLENYDWPGNVREIQNCLERAMILCNGKEITPEDLLLDQSPVRQGQDTFFSDFEIPQSGVSLEDIEKKLILKALEKTDYNQSRAAKLLDITRNTLRYRLEKHDIPILY